MMHALKGRKADWIGHILSRNCLLKHIIKGKIAGCIEVTRTQGRKREQLLDDLKKTKGYCTLKEEALDGTVWRTGFGKVYGPVVRQTTE